MNNNITKKHPVLLIASFALVLIGLLLCFNYFFVADIGTANIIANVSLTLAFLAMIWYMLKGYKNPSDIAFGIPLFMYAFCVIVMNATSTVSISATTPFITAFMDILIVQSIVVAFNQKRVKLCTILLANIIVGELCLGFFTYFIFGPDGIIDGGSITATLNNIHIFVRGFMTSALALCYGARYLRSK